MPIPSFERVQGRIVTLTIESQALRHNMLGDPSRRDVAVYLPPEYDDGDRDFPLFVDLVGFTGSGFSHIAWKSFGESVPQRLERLVREGKMGPVIAAFPDCFTSLGGNQYINSLAMGNWADFLLHEMQPALMSQFRVRPGCRAVFGKSSGGYGAIVHGLRYADHWDALACHSGDLDFELVYRPDFPKFLARLWDFDRDLKAFLTYIEKEPKLSTENMHHVMVCAMAATYDPDPEAWKGVRMPFDLETCAILPERWQAWLQHDPLVLARQPEYLNNLRNLKGIYIDCGSKDQYHLQFGTRHMIRILEQAGIDVNQGTFKDNHNNIDYRMDHSLPYLYASLCG